LDSDVNLSDSECRKTKSAHLCNILIIEFEKLTTWQKISFLVFCQVVCMGVAPLGFSYVVSI